MNIKRLMILALGLAAILAANARADVLPRYSLGGEMVHGGSPGFVKAGGDTINLMSTHNDPTNGPGEPYYFGDFEDEFGNPDWNGWTSWDITDPTESHWIVSDYNQPVAGNLAAWCGDINLPSCDEGVTDPDGGYGNNWHDLLEFRQTVPNTDSSSLVTVTATLIHDTEPGYDYTFLSYRFQGQPFADMQSWDGKGTTPVSNSVTYLPSEYLDGTDIAVYFRFMSDGAFSDIDCSFPSAGGCQVDDINVNISNGAFVEDYFEDFSSGTFGIWGPIFPSGVGDFAHIWTGLKDVDVCNTNFSPQVAFIDDDIVVPGTGGSDCINWCYGPGGHIVTTTGGLAGPTEHIHNAIESPIMDWPDPKNGTGPDYDGIILAFGCFRHEDLSSDAPGIFYNWGIRSADSDGSAGPAQDITEQAWRDRTSVYYGGPDYGSNFGGEVTDLMNPGRDQVQVQLSVYELGWAWGWDGNDGYPAPYFDNVRVKIYPHKGPGMSARELALAQDNFPERGTIDTGDLGSHSVRFDMANNISWAAHLRNDPGDSMVVDIAPIRSGADLDGNPVLHYTVEFNPVFDSYRTAGMPAVGSTVGMPAVGYSGTPAPDKWAFDLPDTGFLFPGDVLHYYIAATDAIGGVGGTDPQTSLMPADTTGYSTGFNDPMGYNSTFVIHALPGIVSDGFDGFDQSPILFINDFANRGGENEWYTAFNNIGLLKGIDYDVYYVNGPSSGVGNGIGGRASALTLSDYDIILYTSGDLSVHTIANGDYNSDAGNDVGTLKDWIDQGNKNIFLTGDDLASDMAQAGTETLDMLENYFGCTLVTNQVSSLIGSQAAPYIKTLADNPVFNGSLESWIAYGGCARLNTFDGVNPTGTGQRLAEFTSPSGGVGQYTFSAATLNIRNPGPTQSNIITMPVDLMFVYTDPDAAGHHFAGRTRLLNDVLMYFGVVGHPAFVPDVSPERIAFEASNHPNPFNPSTTITYSMPKAGHLTLRVYNIRGQLVKTLIDGASPAGSDQVVVWDGTDNRGSAAGSGVYFYEARAAGEVKVGKMTLLK